MHVLCLSAASSLLGRVYVASMLPITWTSWLTELMIPRKQPRYGWQALPTLQFDLILLCSDLDECFLLPRHRKSLRRLWNTQLYSRSSTRLPLSCGKMFSRTTESALIQHRSCEWEIVPCNVREVQHNFMAFVMRTLCIMWHFCMYMLILLVMYSSVALSTK